MAPRSVKLRSANNDFQHAEVLRRNRQRRRQYGEFFLEGVRPINAALAAGWRFTAFYHLPPDHLSDWARDILRASHAATHFEVPPALMKDLSGKTEPSELVATVASPPDDPERIPDTENILVVVFDRPGSPGNLGTLIRSADALGADGVIVTGHGADLYDPETISASRGSLFTLPVVRLGGPREVEEWADRVRAASGPLRIVGTDERGDAALWEHDFRVPTALLCGNETWGLSAAYREMCDAIVRIPIGGGASSLNVAVATSIVLYEVRRQRQAL